MITCKSELDEWLNYEIQKYGLKSIKNRILKTLLCSESIKTWKYHKRLRITEYHYNCRHFVRYMLSQRMLNKLRAKTGISIGLNCFERGLHIVHLGPILVNGRSRVGKDCSIHINTALVAQGKNNDTPVIGDKCIIGVGATIVGGVLLANNIAVGAGAVVTKSFEEENISIAGVPAKKVSDTGTLDWNTNKINYAEQRFNYWFKKGD